MKRLLIISLLKMSDFCILFSSRVAFVASPDHERRRERKCDVSIDPISHRKWLSVISISRFCSILNVENFFKMLSKYFKRKYYYYFIFFGNLQICIVECCALKKSYVQSLRFWTHRRVGMLQGRDSSREQAGQVSRTPVQKGVPKEVSIRLWVQKTNNEIWAKNHTVR